MSVEATKAAIDRYLGGGHTATGLADDAVFTDMNTGQTWTGREAVLGMLDYFYHQAFDAEALDPRVVVGDGHAALEARFHGRHVGEFAGIPATNRDVDVPLCVIYDVEGDNVTRGRIYLATHALFRQLGVTPG